MKLKIFILCFFIKTVMLTADTDLTPYKGGYSKKELFADQVTKITAEKLLHNKNLHLIGTGGCMMNEIENLTMKFDYSKEVDLTTARNLLIVSIQSYLDEINQNEQIRRYLKNYPFTPKNIEIGISIHNPDGSNVSKDKLFYISAYDGILYYYLDGPYHTSRITSHQETYEEALKIINGTK